jgi:transposase
VTGSHGGDRRSEEATNVDNVNDESRSSGNSKDYTLDRLAREAPESYGLEPLPYPKNPASTALKGWGKKKSNNQIAQHIGCSDPTVAKYRRELESTSQITKSTEREGADGRTIDTSNIGGGTKNENGVSDTETERYDRNGQSLKSYAERVGVGYSDVSRWKDAARVARSLQRC